MTNAANGGSPLGVEAHATERLYLLDDHCFEAQAKVVAVRASELAFDRTCFYPGGGGQPADSGRISLDSGAELVVVGVHADPHQVIWHMTDPPPLAADLGQTALLMLDRERRLALARYHTVLHVLNTITLRDYGGWITGAQIATDYARIDFNLGGFSAAMRTELEHRVNAVIAADHSIRSYTLPEEVFRQRGDLLRTLEAQPPVCDGRVRVVEIAGFDAQACGGTHVRTTSEVGRFSIVRTENKGKLNKRLYVRLD